MSIASEITRLRGVKSDILTAISNKGVTVPAGSALDDCPGLIASIPSGSSIPDGYEALPFCYMSGDVNVSSIAFVKEDTIYGMVAPTVVNYQASSNLYLYQLTSNGYDFQARVELNSENWRPKLSEGSNNFSGQYTDYPIPNVISFEREFETNAFIVNSQIMTNSSRVTIDRYFQKLNKSGCQKKAFFYTAVKRGDKDIIRFIPAKRISDGVVGLLEIYSGSFYTTNISAS